MGKLTMPTFFHDNVHTNGCKFFATILIAQMTLTISCGFNMALYRLFSMKGKRFEVKYFIASTLALEFLFLSSFLSANEEIGWETRTAYRYCIDYQPNEMKTLGQTKYKSTNIKLLMNRSIGLALTIAEFGIYLCIIWDLWNTDQRHHQSKIITGKMLQKRKEKNVLTLKGQICTFITKVALLIAAMIVLISGRRIFSVDEKYATPFLIIVPYSVISFAQILSSHELKRYVKSKFD